MDLFPKVKDVIDWGLSAPDTSCHPTASFLQTHRLRVWLFVYTKTFLQA